MCVHAHGLCIWLVKCLDTQSKADLNCGDLIRRHHTEWLSEQPICFLQEHLSGWATVDCNIIGYTTHLFGFWIIWTHPHSTMWTISFKDRENNLEIITIYSFDQYLFCAYPYCIQTLCRGWGNTKEWSLVIIFKEFLVLKHSLVNKL